MSQGRGGTVIIVVISGSGHAVLQAQTPGTDQDGEDTHHILWLHPGLLANYSPEPNPAPHLLLFYWLVATPMHLLTVCGLLQRHNCRTEWL